MYAVFETGGKQYRVEVGDELFIEKLPCEAGETLVFDRVLAVCEDGSGLEIGSPYVTGKAVTASVLKNGKGKKITVFTYKPKKGSARKLGHRQPYTKIKITAIGLPGEAPPAGAEAPAAAPEAEQAEQAE